MHQHVQASITLIVWACMSIHLSAPPGCAQNFNLRVFWSDTSFHEMSCSARSSDGCLSRFVRNIRGEAITNCMLTPMLPPCMKKILPLSNKAYRPIPRELALHVFDKWTYTSPSISRSSRAQGRQAPVYFPPSLSILNRPIRGCQSCIPARGWQVGSCDARAVHSFRWHSANICMVEAARLRLFALSQWKQIHRQTGREREGHRTEQN